jgi:hypothetical protein
MPGRDEAAVARALSKLTAAAYSAVTVYATRDEVLAAYEQGVLEALDRLEVHAAAVREVQEIADRYAARRQAA